MYFLVDMRKMTSEEQREHLEFLKRLRDAPSAKILPSGLIGPHGKTGPDGKRC